MDSDTIKQLIETLLKHLQISVEEISVSDTDGRTCFAIRTPDSQLLIGTNGANLHAFNHLVKRMVSAKSGTAGKATETSLPSANEREHAFFVDVNGYQEAALLNIKNAAKMMGERARSFKASVEMEPMSSYERMIIHAFFQEATDLKTESVGEGDKRRVVIKYVEPTESL